MLDKNVGRHVASMCHGRRDLGIPQRGRQRQGCVDRVIEGMDGVVRCSRMALVLDRNIGAPLVIALGDSARPLMEMRFTSYRLFEDPPNPDTFSYEPAEGVMVMDLGPMLEMMAGE